MLRLPLTPLSLRRLLDGDVGDLGAAEKLRGQSGRNFSVDLNDVRALLPAVHQASQALSCWYWRGPPFGEPPAQLRSRFS